MKYCYLANEESSLIKNFVIKEIDTSLNEKAYDEFIEFKKTKVFNSHNA